MFKEYICIVLYYTFKKSNKCICIKVFYVLISKIVCLYHSLSDVVKSFVLSIPDALVFNIFVWKYNFIEKFLLLLIKFLSQVYAGIIIFNDWCSIVWDFISKVHFTIKTNIINNSILFFKSAHDFLFFLLSITLNML